MTRAALPEPRTRLLVVGKPGAGKSTHVKALLADWQRRGLRIVALDPCDEYSRQGNAASLVQLGGLKHRTTPAELARRPELLTERRLSLAVVTGEHPRDAARGFLLLARLVRAARRPVVVVADEVGLWTDKATGRAAVDAEAELKALAIGGRKHGVPLVLVAQRAAQVAATVRSTCTEIHAFHQDEPRDLQALAERTGDAAFAARVARLPPYRFEAWRDDAHRPLHDDTDAPNSSADEPADEANTQH